MSGNTNFTPMGCLSEHLNYFSENIASKNPILDSDFDDIFTKDFDLVFDPELLMNGHSTAAVASASQPAPAPVQSSHEYEYEYAYEAKPVPVSVCSNPNVAPVTPAVPPKPVVKAVPQLPNTIIHKAAAAPTVSPTSVTTVFDAIPQAAGLPRPKPKSTPRKRSYSMVETAPKPAPVTSADTSNLSFQEQEDLRRERNRHHAKRSRQRKRDYMNQLEDAVNDMRKENERLFELLGMDSRKAKVDMAKEEEHKKALATDKFIAGLKQPRNRVLDNTTLAFLRELWK